MREFNVSTDNRLNQELKEDVQVLRGGMLECAEQVKAPDRFKFEPIKDIPVILITDTATNKKSTVPLCDYTGVRKVLNDLF